MSLDINKLVRENVKKMKPYSSARDEFENFTQQMIYLDANENPFDSMVNRYPDPFQLDLKLEIAGLKGLDVNQVFVGNGSDEVLDLLFRAFCEPNKDAVITFPPTYGMYNVLANLNAIENIQVPLASNFELEVDKILANVKTNTKLLFICSPNNPSGNTVDCAAIEQLLSAFNGLVVIDEAYIDFTDETSWTERINSYPNLIVTQTLSKAYGLAGIRLGACYASEEIIAVLNKIKPPYNVNQLTQDKALERLNALEKVNEEVNQILSERKILRKALKSISIVEKVYKSDANFLLVKVDDADKRYKQLIEKGMVVRNRTNQPLCENCLRFTIGTQQENEKLIKTLKELS
mgnify:CR=1 FL=1